MATKKLQLLNTIMKEAENADTLDGKHASEFALATDFSDLQTVVDGKADTEHTHEIDDIDGILPIAQGGTGASDAATALTNLGAVSKSGDTMTGKLTAPQVDIVNPTNVYPRIVLSCSDGTNNGKSQYSSDTSTGKAYIAEWANGSNYYETYNFPTPATNLTSNENYSVLTSKSAVTVAQGGTGATTAADARTALGAVSKDGDTITGTLTLSKTTDASGVSNTSPALIVGGTATTAHIAIDANEIIAKSNGTTPTTLHLGEVSTSSIVSINGLFRMGTTNNFGTTLPAAGKAGRVFFKKVSS